MTNEQILALALAEETVKRVRLQQQVEALRKSANVSVLTPENSNTTEQS